jgi:hypothetical protein
MLMLLEFKSLGIERIGAVFLKLISRDLVVVLQALTITLLRED